MAIVKQCGYDHYVHRKINSAQRAGKNLGRIYRNTFLIQANPNTENNGVLFLQAIYFPEKFIGKRIRLKVELVDELEEKDKE